ncbi:MAG TPA: nuclear transport factor 2 family protein [Dehalococcoidia bacterium]|nr:nuclear transport factor 2 family protein [Dehalococcoidia bacterium]
MIRPLAAALALSLASILAACGASSGAGPAPAASTTTAVSPAATSPANGAPLDDFKALLAALNARDAAGVGALLSAEARKDLSGDRLAAFVTNLTRDDPSFKVEIQTVGRTQVTGDQAQIEMTLLVDYQGKQYPLQDVAYLVREAGRWKLADHFLQTAMAAVGLGAPPAAPRVYRADGCVEGAVLAGVYLPSRLKVLDPCLTVEGVVREVESVGQGEGDGDISFNVELAPADQRLLNEGNIQNMHGWLHMEIVPMDQPRLPKPQVGQRIRVQGPWVTDIVHGHNEIHPVWSLTVLPQ